MTARLFEPLIPGFVRRAALRKAERWFIERLNGEDGLGAIFPAMVNAYEALGLQLVMGERSGIGFQDAYDGTWYVNCHCNGGVFNLGHRNRAVVDAVRSALDHLDVGNHHLVSGWRAALAAGGMHARTPEHLARPPMQVPESAASIEARRWGASRRECLCRLLLPNPDR